MEGEDNQLLLLFYILSKHYGGGIINHNNTSIENSVLSQSTILLQGHNQQGNTFFNLHNYINSVQSTLISYLFEHPGSGNFTRCNTHSLINEVRGWSRLHSLQNDMRFPAFRAMVGCSATIFQELCDMVRPYILLPKRLSQEVFRDDAAIRYIPAEDYAEEMSGHGRPPSQHPDDRFLHFFIYCRRAGRLSQTIEGILLLVV